MNVRVRMRVRKGFDVSVRDFNFFFPKPVSHEKSNFFIFFII